MRLGYHPQEDGLLMWEGSFPSRTSESVFSWKLVAGFTAQLIDKREYFINTSIKPFVPKDPQQLTFFDLPAQPALRCSPIRSCPNRSLTKPFVLGPMTSTVGSSSAPTL